MKTRIFVIGLATLTLLAITVGATAAYTLSVSNTVDTPQQEVTIEGETFTISEASIFNPGTVMDVAVEQSDDTIQDYRVVLYNSQRDRVTQSRRQTGNQEFSFNTTNLAPGSYLFAVNDGNFQTVHPVVINGFKVTVQTRTEVTADEQWGVTAELERLDEDAEIERVEVVLWNPSSGEAIDNSSASAESERTYSTQQTAPEAAGIYELRVVVFGPSKVAGEDENEAIASSDAVEIEVNQPDRGDSPTPTPDEDESALNGGGTGGTSSDTEGGSDDAETEDSNGVTPTVTPTLTVTETVGNSTRASNDSTPTDSDVITPSERDSTLTETPPEEQPGFGIDGVVAALLGLILISARRR